MPQDQPTTPTHAGGCPCEGCEAERAALARCLAILEETREIASTTEAR